MKGRNGMVQMDQQQLTWALSLGFIKMFGEEHRELFEEHQQEMVEAGVKAGYEAYWGKIVKTKGAITSKLAVENRKTLRKTFIKALRKSTVQRRD